MTKESAQIFSQPLKFSGQKKIPTSVSFPEQIKPKRRTELHKMRRAPNTIAPGQNRIRRSSRIGGTNSRTRFSTSLCEKGTFNQRSVKRPINKTEGIDMLGLNSIETQEDMQIITNIDAPEFEFLGPLDTVAEDTVQVEEEVRFNCPYCKKSLTHAEKEEPEAYTTYCSIYCRDEAAKVVNADKLLIKNRTNSKRTDIYEAGVYKILVSKLTNSTTASAPKKSDTGFPRSFSTANLNSVLPKSIFEPKKRKVSVSSSSM